MLSRPIVFCFALALPVFLFSCAIHDDDFYSYDDSDPASGYRGIEYENGVMAGRIPRDPNYLQPRRPAYIPSTPTFQAPDYAANRIRIWGPEDGIGQSRLSGGMRSSIPQVSSSGYSAREGNSGRMSFPGSRRASSPSTTYDSDYRSTQLLGGGRRVDDCWGNSMTHTQNIDGSSRATSGRGTTYQGEKTLGGGYKITGSNGSSYQREQLLDGSYQYKGNDGTTYRREQTLGGGYKYTRR